ncbi:class II aldolase/adducin family protein [Rugosimonospora africana]|uniref:Aldolase n=1 Tax=Rugosimonospora africana TaxID=556532 RepID=A0A8J3QPI1_9ACTN|nr:class II aldolase/adducin family protein [Rugosimonospora africana]GIH14029.1 aldolase [Rugosimonospora africana]
MSSGRADVTSRPDLAELRETVAVACRVMAERGLVEHVLGHISARLSASELLVRCRGPEESGLAYTTAEDILPVSLDGGGDHGAWAAPNELPIHTELMRRRPAIGAVVHAHPPAVVALSLVGVPPQPIYGAYDIPGARLAADGIPTWDRSSLIRTPALAAEMADALGDRPVLILRGHGLVSVAEGPPRLAVARAVLQAVAVDTLARTTLTVLSSGGVPRPISDEDLAELPDLGSGFTVDTLWRHLCRRLTA